MSPLPEGVSLSYYPMLSPTASITDFKLVQYFTTFEAAYPTPSNIREKNLEILVYARVT